MNEQEKKLTNGSLDGIGGGEHDNANLDLHRQEMINNDRSFANKGIVVPESELQSHLNVARAGSTANSMDYDADIDTDIANGHGRNSNTNNSANINNTHMQAISRGSDNAVEHTIDDINIDQYASIPPITRPVSIDMDCNQTDIDHDENDVDTNPISHIHMHEPDSTNTNNHEDILERSSMAHVPPPRQSEQTAREQLIERERQARLEREKAKLKQQLALSREREEEDQAFEEADDARIQSDASIANTSNLNIDLHLNISLNEHDDDDDDDDDNGHEGINMNGNSVECEEGGIGDVPVDVKVDIDRNHDLDREITLLGNTHEEEDHNIVENANGMVDKPSSPLGYTMERFLQEGVGDVTNGTRNLNDQGGAAAALDVDADVNSGEIGSSNTVIASDEIPSALESAIHPEPQPLGDSTLMNMRAPPPSESNVGAPETASNVSMEAHDQSESSHTAFVTVSFLSPNSPIRHHGHHDQQGDAEHDLSAGDDDVVRNLPRLAQLTEAEILEMTDLDYASVGNMPPRSVRDERHLPDISGMSHTSFDQTNTTMQASDMSAGIDSSHAGSYSLDTNNQEVEPPLDSPVSNVARVPEESFASPTSNTSVVAQQCDISIERSDVLDRKPAAIVNVDRPQISDDLEGGKWLNSDINDWQDEHGNETKQNHNREIHIESLALETNDVDSSGESYNLPNRIMRPGMIKVASSSSRGHRRAQTTPNIPSFVDDFDYCKYNDVSGTSNRGSPFFGFDVESSNSNSQVNGHLQNEGAEFSNYGSTDVESQPLLTTIAGKSEFLGDSSHDEIDMDDMINSVFSSLRSMSTADIQAEIKDCDKYSSSPALSRAISERCLPLIVTAVIEVPVLLMISGGSGRLCALIGRGRYQLVMAFLPLSSAISGNCGLQAGTLATRAISHLHVTKDNYFKWLLTEIQVSAILGLVMGFLIGLVAFQASGFDIEFGFVIFLANLICVVTSGLTGTLAPIIFRLAFHRDAGKWDNLLATAFQDIVGTFVMVIFTFHLLKILGPSEVGGEDVCT